MKHKRTLIDLFAGGGLFSWGFVRPRHQSEPWDLVLAVDVDEAAVTNLRTNFIGCQIAHGDLNCTSPEWWRWHLGFGPKEVGLLHASPPCADFSQVNRRHATRSDEAFKVVWPWVAEWKPAAVCLENVPSFKSSGRGQFHQEVLAMLEELGYIATSFVLDAAAFGAPQFRRRLFYLAYRADFEEVPQQPQATHSPTAYVSVREAIGGLPHRLQGDSDDILEVDCRRATQYEQLMMGKVDATNGHAARKLNEEQMERLANIGPGEAWEVLPPALQPRAGFRHCYGRLDPTRPAFTITTGVGAPSRGCFSHYEQDRLITFREAARLQSISDDYVLVGSRVQRARIVGNAVPPLMAEGIKTEVERALWPSG